MVNTDDTTKNNVPRINKRPLVANTPALRFAQLVLKHKAELSFHLTKMEPILNKSVQNLKQLVQKIAAGLAGMNAVMGGNFRKRFLELSFDILHNEGQRMMMAGSCERVWKEDSDLLASLEELEAEKEKAQKEWEMARKKLRILRVRKKNAIRCVEVLKAYLEEVREKQQGTI
ncbi:hypothetical protein BFW01_g5516 [Lasiodiplodia theobromae]|uniref:uncharacterized protein n=1 Tax=Lasiodiplodia theobromae TaxID=45133 RepID=UPI0015C36043|nr:uncharacterized protein LTHEOB_837 [Lasiodiplodia theobromae]KAF4540895.1 hypothetical protein LTHEOB_837 [Lasiodiplodia theobromae]KAF9634621.1 hypothetical protein BFW01_g5516 [Lasiodiplodia theobromae]